MDLEETAALASVLGNSVRLAILQLLLQSGPRGLIVGDIQKAVNLPGSTLSHHLERLRDSGFVSIRRQGTFLWYFPVSDRVRAFAGMLLGLSAGTAAGAKAEALAPLETADQIDIEFD